MPLPHPLGPYPFSRAQMLAAGVSAEQWRAILATGRLHRMRHGVYVLEPATDDRTRYAQKVAARLVTLAQHFAVSDSAAAFHEFPNPWFRPWSSREVAIAGPKCRTDRGIRCARDSEPVQTRWGLAQNPVEAAMAIAAPLPLPQALMVTDHAARALAATTDRFTLTASWCRDGVRDQLRTVADLPAAQVADPAAESPAESFCRGHMILRGFDELRCGVPVQGWSGAQYFVDLLLGNLAIEVDGLVKYQGADGVQVLIAEKQREDDLRATGLDFHRVFVEDLFAQPEREMDRIQARR